MPDVTLFLTRFPKSEFTEKADITWDTTGWTQEEILRLHGWKGATLPTNAKDVLRLEQELLQ